MNIQTKNNYKSKIPAIVLGSSITTLGVLRSLGELRIPSIYLSNENNFISYSKWCKSKVQTSKNLSDGNSLTKILENLPVERAVLFPCSDPILMNVAGLSSSIKARFPSSIADTQRLNNLLDKAGLAETLNKFDLPHPETHVIKKQDDLKNLEVAKFAGAFLKPCDSSRFLRQYGVKAIHVQNREDAITKVREIQEAGHSIVLQEYIPGPKSNHYFIDGFVNRFGKICTLFARRRMRMFPADFGNSSYMYSVPLRDVSGAVQTLEKLFANIKYRGIFSTEFKYDYRDNLYKVIEINVRPWWYIEFATSCGINVCKLAYQDALEQDVSELKDYKEGTSLVYLYYDFLSCLQMHREQKLTIWSWLKSWCWAKHPIFRWDDPLPAIVKTFKWIFTFIKRRINKQ
jgi:D-aspartate ligase